MSEVKKNGDKPTVVEILNPEEIMDRLVDFIFAIYVTKNHSEIPGIFSQLTLETQALFFMYLFDFQSMGSVLEIFKPISKAKLRELMKTSEETDLHLFMSIFQQITIFDPFFFEDLPDIQRFWSKPYVENLCLNPTK